MKSKASTTILVVEDDPSLNKLIVLELEEAGYSAVLARTAEDALELLKKCKPDLIWLDMYLPSMDGFQFLEHLRGDPKTKDIKVAVVSVSGSDSREKQAKKFNVVGYFVKSNYRLDELVKAVGALAERR
ncbi:response regulator [Patescibacteria group bacterium]|nr:response regulator [Patescibacteria group bacterium]